MFLVEIGDFFFRLDANQTTFAVTLEQLPFGLPPTAIFPLFIGLILLADLVQFLEEFDVFHKDM